MSDIAKHFENEVGKFEVPKQPAKNQEVGKREETPYQLSTDEIMQSLQLADAVTSKEMASLAGRVLRSKTPVSLEDSQRLAGSVLRQYVKDLQSRR